MKTITPLFFLSLLATGLFAQAGTRIPFSLSDFAEFSVSERWSFWWDNQLRLDSPSGLMWASSPAVKYSRSDEIALLAGYAFRQRAALAPHLANSLWQQVQLKSYQRKTEMETWLRLDEYLGMQNPSDGTTMTLRFNSQIWLHFPLSVCKKMGISAHNSVTLNPGYRVSSENPVFDYSTFFAGVRFQAASHRLLLGYTAMISQSSLTERFIFSGGPHFTAFHTLNNIQRKKETLPQE